MKKSLEKSKIILEENRKMVGQKFAYKKTHTFKIIACHSRANKNVTKRLKNTCCAVCGVENCQTKKRQRTQQKQKPIEDSNLVSLSFKLYLKKLASWELTQ